MDGSDVWLRGVLCCVVHYRCIPTYLSIYFFVCLSIYLSIYPSVYPSIYLSIYLSPPPPMNLHTPTHPHTHT